MQFRFLSTDDLTPALVLNDLEWPDLREMYTREFWYAQEGTGPFQMRFCGVEHGGCLIAAGMVADSTITIALGGLSWIVVAPEFRRQGVGQFLVRGLEQVAVSELGKTDMLFSTDLPQFYETLGYRTVANMASRPEWADMVLMHRPLVSCPMTVGGFGQLGQMG